MSESKRFAIILGVEEYQNFEPTPFARADADLMFATLTQSCDYSPENCLLLKPTRDEEFDLRKFLWDVESRVKNCTVSDTVLFFFAGHGLKEGDEAYLLVPNSRRGALSETAISFRKMSDRLRVRERTCFQILDACHSGVDSRSDDGGAEFLRAVTARPEGWVTIAACGADEKSSVDPDVGHGIFTYELCSYVTGLSSGERVFPESIKLAVVEAVYQRAKRRGCRQTPTLNGSITGNLVLANRVVRDVPAEARAVKVKSGLLERAERLRTAPRGVVEPNWLEKVRDAVATQTLERLKSGLAFYSEVKISDPKLAQDLPDSIQASIVDFTRRRKWQPRHLLDRIVHEEDDWTVPKFVRQLYGKKPKRKIVNYSIWQEYSDPPSVVVLHLPTDGFCIPEFQLVIYILPLQLSVCLIASLHQQGWPPRSSDLSFSENFFQICKGSDLDAEDAGISFGKFVAQRVIPLVQRAMEARIEALEYELEDDPPLVYRAEDLDS